MKGLLLFTSRMSLVQETVRTFNPTSHRNPNEVYSQGMETRDMQEEVFKRFGKGKSAMNATDFYAGDRLAFVIDLRSI